MLSPQKPILVVDDDHTILHTVSEILHLEGYPVATATNGAEALREIERVQPSLVLLDMRMPVLDGWGFAKQVRERGLNVPILVMTAAQDAGLWAGEIQAEGFLAKPFDLMDLLEAVSRLRGGCNDPNGANSAGGASGVWDQSKSPVLYSS